MEQPFDHALLSANHGGVASLGSMDTPPMIPLPLQMLTQPSPTAPVLPSLQQLFTPSAQPPNGAGAPPQRPMAHMHHMPIGFGNANGTGGAGGSGPTPRITPAPISVASPLPRGAAASASLSTAPASASSYGLNPNNVRILNVPHEPLSDVAGLISLVQAEYEKVVYELDPTLPQPLRHVVHRSSSSMARKVPAAATVSAKCPEALQYSYSSDYGVWYPVKQENDGMITLW